VCEVFVLLAGGTPLHILFDPLSCTWPMETLQHFRVVSSLPGWPISPSWYACIILRLSSSTGGTSILPSSAVHRVIPFVCRPLCSLIHPKYFPCSRVRRYSSESSLPVSARFRNTSEGRRVTCRSLCCHSSSLGRDRASAGVLFFP
jgi:hypothetical protein